MTDDRYTLNSNDDGPDVLHRNAGEECNQDDALDKKRVDAKTAATLLMQEQVQTCGHCWPDDSDTGEPS
ncbi:MAG: hypothetical protein H0W24_02435 [Lysobacter sp.]|nr:hypothetical protein [Lysobacter sp.]